MSNPIETKERVIYPVRLNDWAVVLEGEIPTDSQHDLLHPYLRVRWFKSPEPNFPEIIGSYLDSEVRYSQPDLIRRGERVEDWDGALAFSWFREPDFYSYAEWQRPYDGPYHRKTTILYQEKTLVIASPSIYESKGGWDIFVLAKYLGCHQKGFHSRTNLYFPNLGVSRFYIPQVTTGEMHWRHPFYLPFDTPERDIATALKGINLVLNTELSHKREDS